LSKRNERHRRRLGPIDINNAGMGYTGTLSKTPVGLAASDESESYQCISVHFRILPMMRGKGSTLSTFLLPVNNPFQLGSLPVSKV